MATFVPEINPFTFPDVYDTILFNETIVSPGQLLQLSGLKRETAWDVKDGNGQNGASITKKGDKLVKFSATFGLVYDVVAGIDDFTDWYSFLPLLKSTAATKTPVALSVYHPDISALDIDSVVVESIGAFEHDGKGGAKVTVGFIEYKPPKKTGGSPQKKPGNDPNADVKAELDALVKAAQGA